MTERPVDRLPAIGAALRLAAHRFGTPVAVTDIAELEAAASAVAGAFPDPWLRAFSVKANDVAPIVGRLARLGWAANVVSRGEWAVARRAGLPNAAITIEGGGKTDDDLRAAIRAARAGDAPRWLTVESLDEARALVGLAHGAPGRGALDVLVRLNPGVAPETHAGFAVGAGGSKFGLTADEASEAVAVLARGRGVQVRGVHLHVGSQLRAIDAWREAVRRALALVAFLRGSWPTIDTLDVGGGFPVLPLGEPAPDAARFAREIPGLLEAVPPDRRPERLAIEPGRALVARSGYLVGRVLHARERDGRAIVLDTGMTELLRPALYGARHPVAALTSLGAPVGGGPVGRSGAPPSEAAAPTHVDGPICESTDDLGDHDLPPLRRGDLVVIRDTGAYAASMASSYNGRPRPPQVLLEADGRLVLARRRGVTASLG